MAIQFVVEDGSSKSDATSYVSVADADQYHENHGTAAWVLLSNDEKETSLIRATSYLDSYFEWSTGRKSDEDQALDWPRIGAYDDDRYYIDDDEIPQAVKDACCELAVRASSGDIVADSEQAIKSFVAGPVEVEFESGSDSLTSYNQVDMLLRGLVSSSSVARVDLL